MTRTYDVQASQSSASPRAGRPAVDGLLALAAGLLAGLVYWRGAAPGLLFGDSGELQFAAWTAGLPHPTGYPLYMLLGWAWSHLSPEGGLGLATPARALNLLSAICAALAVAFTYLLAHSLSEASLPRTPAWLQRLAGLLAALTFAFTPTFWSQAIVAEVYALHAALVALILWLAVTWRKGIDAAEETPGAAKEDTSRRPGPGGVLAALALAFGLGLAHHRTTLLLAPVLLVFLWLGANRGYWRRRWRWLATMGLLVLAPLALYAYVPLRAGHTPYLVMELRPGQPVDLLDRSPAGLASYLLGRGFAGELQSAQQALAAAPGLLERFSAELTVLGLGLAVLGAGILAARRRWSLLWLTGGSFLAATAFNLFYTIGDIAVFYIPAYLIACAWIGVAVAWFCGLVWRLLPTTRHSSGEQQGAPRFGQGGLRDLFIVIVVTATFLLPTSLFASHAAALSRSADEGARVWWNALLASNPRPGALLVSNDRDEMMPLWYLQQVEGVRPDLAGVFPLLLPGPGWATIGQVLQSALDTGRPVYLVKPMPGIEVKVRTGPAEASGLTPVQGVAASDPRPRQARAAQVGEELELLGYDLTPATIEPGQELMVDLYWRPQRAVAANLTSFVHVLLPDGAKIAQSDHAPGGVFYPTSLWQPGETLLDRHILSLPTTASPGPYRLVAGLYELVDNGAAPPRPVGSVDLGELIVAGAAQH